MEGRALRWLPGHTEGGRWMHTSGAEIKSTEKEEYLRKIKFNFRYVENEVLLDIKTELEKRD